VRSSALATTSLLSLLFGCDSGAPYRKKDGAWYFKDERLDAPASARLTPLGDTFAKGAGRVWYRAMSVDGADERTFAALDAHWAKDVRRVYYCDTYRKGQEYYLIKHDRVRVLDGADAATFRVLAQGYARDARAVYHDGAPMAVRDVASFEPLDYGFARDRVTGYYLQEPVPGSDGSTFAIVDNHYAKDAAHVFYSDVNLDEAGSPPAPRTVRLADADPASFVALDYGYGKDAHAVYHHGARVDGADAATFATLDLLTDSADAQDRHGRYRDGRRR
jgi:hypothetical protein